MKSKKKSELLAKAFPEYFSENKKDNPMQDKVINKLKEIWKREHYDDLEDSHSVSGYQIVGVLLEVFNELKKPTKINRQA